MTNYTDFIDFSEPITYEAVERFIQQQRPKPGRKVIWNSYSLGTYIKAKHGPIGTPRHK